MNTIYQNISLDRRQRLAYLVERIDNGNATAAEYIEYENILKESGINKEKIERPLKTTHAKNWEEFAKRRKMVKKSNDFDEKNLYEGVLTGALVGLGMYLLYMIFDSDNKK